MDEKKTATVKEKPAATPAKGVSVKLILASPRRIDGRIREPKFTLLEGVCGKNVTADEVTKAIAAGAVRVEEDVF